MYPDNLAPAPRPVYTCDACGTGIYDGEGYYEVVDGRYCRRCVEDMQRTAHEDDLVREERVEDIA